MQSLRVLRVGHLNVSMASDWYIEEEEKEEEERQVGREGKEGYRGKGRRKKEGRGRQR